MVCPHCRAGNLDDETYCIRCGKELTAPTTSLATINNRLPAVLHNPQLPRVAAGVGAVAVGVGIELLRRGLLARLAKSSRSVERALPVLSGLQDILLPQPDKTSRISRRPRLPKGYEVHESIYYVRRVIRRED
ncbi:MAG: zinc-ribbon domain-containing protein [Chloroflexota bacterium]|nr:zinc-ribbon domain-containing protein [Chloroflexota bacterium]